MSILKSLFSSKKFVVALGTALGAIVIKLGAPESVNELIPYFLGLAGTYIVGQGIADHGKEKTKEENKPKTKTKKK